jgi:23S rRNA pseudouridine955/2504/2580 synthase
MLAVGESGSGQRLDNFLARVLKGVPRSHIYRIVRSGEVRVNGARAEVSQKLAGSDLVRVPPVRMAEAAPAAPARQYPMLHEDAWLLAINKPAGIAVHGGSGLSFGVIESLRASQQDRFLELVHRLDRDTSGVLLLAKKRSALTTLHASLREREADKRYFVLVAGLWQGEAVTVNQALHKYLTASGERRVCVAKADEGQAARSQFRPVRRFPWTAAVVTQTGVAGLTLMEARIHTGRTHQIRVHLQSLGFPVVGDDKYGNDALNRLLARGEAVPGLPRNARMFLHAAHLALSHPHSGDPLLLQADWPSEDARWLQRLGELCPPVGNSSKSGKYAKH